MANDNPADIKDPIQRALAYAVRYGGIDGDHHKAWVIDQMVRALTGCPTVEKTASSYGKLYTYSAQGESDEYKQLVAEACDGEDGPDTYTWNTGVWDVGIAP
jgi:hypothetical protein